MAINNHKRVKDGNIFVYDLLVSHVPAATAAAAAAAAVMILKPRK